MLKRKVQSIIIWKNPKHSEIKVLLLKLNPQRGSHWQPVTGHVEENENYPDAALREATEETGLCFKAKTVDLNLEFTFDGKWGKSVERAFLLAVTDSESPPTPILSEEHIDFCWLNPNAAMNLVSYEQQKNAILLASENKKL